MDTIVRHFLATEMSTSFGRWPATMLLLLSMSGGRPLLVVVKVGEGEEWQRG